MNNSLDGYESPVWIEVKKFCDEVVEERENALMMQIKEQTALHITKDELVKALNYDRDQYSKGYSNGYNKGYKKGREDAIEDLKKVINGEESNNG